MKKNLFILMAAISLLAGVFSCKYKFNSITKIEPLTEFNSPEYFWVIYKENNETKAGFIFEHSSALKTLVQDRSQGTNGGSLNDKSIHIDDINDRKKIIASNEIVLLDKSLNPSLAQTFNIIRIEGKPFSASPDSDGKYLVTVLCSNNTYKCLYRIDRDMNFFPLGYAAISKDKGFKAAMVALPFFMISLLFFIFGRSAAKKKTTANS